jgi:parvulin-like peptidyl-prolyl isomerase
MTIPIPLFAVALWLAGASLQQADGNRVIASTADWSITAQQFETILSTLPDQARAFYSNPANRRRFLDEVIEMWVIAAEAKAKGVDKAPATRAILDFYTNNIISNEYQKLVADTNMVTDTAIDAYYKANEADYREVRLSHILILNAEGPAVRGQNIPNALSAAEARQKIEEVRAKLVPGASFENLAKEYSQDPGSAANGGDLGFISKGQLVPEVESVAFEIEPGVLSEIVESPFGFHILRVSERRATPLADVRETIRQRVNNDQVTEQIQSRIRAADVKVDESFFTR